MVVGVVILVAIIVYFCTQKSRSSYQRGKQPVREGFTSLAAGANDNTGMLLDDAYDLVQSADQAVPAPHFADLVAQGDHLKNYVEQPKLEGENLRPMERLHRVQGRALMPRISRDVTPFNIDVAVPTTQKYMVNTPRVTTALRSRYRDTSMSTMIRGDVMITYNPNVPLIAKSHIGRDALNLTGMFTPYYRALYNKYTGQARKSLVTKVAGAGQAAGYGGAAGGVLMDGN